MDENEEKDERMLQWLDVDQISDGERYNYHFSSEIIEYIKKLRVVFADVYNKSMNEWVDGFCYDKHPKREIAIWLVMADAYLALKEHYHPSHEMKRELLTVLLMCSSGVPNEQIIEQVKPTHLTSDDIDYVMHTYRKSA